MAQRYAPLHSRELEDFALELARKSIVHFLSIGRLSSGHRPHTAEELGLRCPEPFQSRLGVFVSLYVNGVLRGCIGDLQAERPLERAIIARAVDAASEDWRFEPLRPTELSAMRLELSILSVLREGTVDELELGRHGVLLSKEGLAAVFLPQVAVEQGWSKPQMLSALCRKAGLRADDWREGASFGLFEAQVLSE